MVELTTPEQYALAQILVCGDIKQSEFQNMNEFSGVRQQVVLESLEEYGLLDQTLYNDTVMRYEEQ